VRDSYTPAQEFYRILTGEFLPAVQAGEKDKARGILMNVLSKSYAEHRKFIDTAVTLAIERNSVDEQQGKKLITVRTWMLGFAIAIAMAVSSVLAFFVMRRLLRAVDEISRATQAGAVGDFNVRLVAQSRDELGAMVKDFERMSEAQRRRGVALQEIANGNLCVDVQPDSERDEFGTSLRRLVEVMSQTMTEVQDVANQVLSGANEVDKASNFLSSGATEQAASVEEISATVGEMASEAKVNAAKAVSASEAAAKSFDAAKVGENQVASTVAAMKEISASGQQISRVIKIIDDIAFQTNLLALNAAVEAARAGKHGKGFAVVANEVRNLAGRSAKAAQETTALIEASIRSVENGVKQAESTAQSFQLIADGVANTSSALKEIVQRSSGQASSAGQISQALDGVNQVTQQNTASAEENAAAAKELFSFAQRLQKTVSRFQVRS
jgi:methyl-accepting chemotaxis protein